MKFVYGVADCPECKKWCPAITEEVALFAWLEENGATWAGQPPPRPAS